MNSFIKRRLAIYQALQASAEAVVGGGKGHEAASSTAGRPIAIIKGEHVQLSCSHANEQRGLVTLLDNLKVLGAQKDALFAKVRYVDESVANLATGSRIKDTDEIEEETEAKAKAWRLQMLDEPILGDCEVELVGFEDEEAAKAFRHSSAHILGAAIEQVYDEPLLTIGPPVQDGFFYDFFSPSGQVVRGAEDYKAVEKAMAKIVGRNHPFERLIVSKEQALDLFSYNHFKVELIEKKVGESELTSVFRIGDFIDLCTGPHIPSTKYMRGFKVLKHSHAYWLGDASRESLQRMYGTSFPSKSELAEHLKLQEEAKRRDHRVIGQDQELFFFSPLSPGSAFFLPHGAKIHNKLVEFMRLEYRKRGFQEVVTPNLYNVDLWKTSGHYKNYKDNLYLLKNSDGPSQGSHSCGPGEAQGLKPMNCPGHCLIFKNKTHSYKELPIKLADFGVLHRNELSGALTGLTRVRRFQQDDAHIFCRRDQIEAEVLDCLQFLEHVYGLFGFDYQLFLSTRPADSLGSDELWEEAESQLRQALESCGRSWKVNKGDGAFYGPKIDIVIQDALGRPQQCGTIQLDFQLPIRFNLQYTTSTENESSPEPLASEIIEPDEYSHQPFEWREKPLKPKSQRPVMIHRAVFGSLERFFAILIEHLGGKWPLWLSPRQVKICSLASSHAGYCLALEKELKDKGWEVELDISEASLNKKVRNAQLRQFNYILVVGDEEEQHGTVDVRQRDGQRLGKLSLEQFEKTMIDSYPDGVALPHRSYKSNKNIGNNEI